MQTAMQTTQYKYLKPYERPANYGGTHFFEYYAVYGIHRDSDLLEQSNYDCILKELGGESEDVIVSRANHWAVGWIDTIRIKVDAAPELLHKADQCLAALAEYPIYNEDHYFSLQEEAIYDYWQGMMLRDRIELCDSQGYSIFAARHKDIIPEDVFDYLRDSDIFA